MDKMRKIRWNYCKDPNDINYVIERAVWDKSFEWEGITAENIISITWDENQGCYVVFWRHDNGY